MPLFRREVFDHRATRHRLHGEVILTQSLSTTVMIGALSAIAVVAALWISMGTYARIETVPGLLVTDRPSAKVVASAPGIIKQLLVQEGQVVRKGQRLAVVTVDRFVRPDEAVATEGLVAVEERLNISDEQIKLADQRAANEADKLREAIASAERKRTNLSEQIRLQREIVASNRAMFEMVTKVVERGFVSKVEFEHRRQTLLNSEQSLKRLEQEQMGLASDATQSRAQLASLKVETESEKSDIRSSIQVLTQQHAQLRGEQAYEILAPISGRVAVVQAGEGQMATGTVPLMMIVPVGATLKAEVYAPSRAIGLVRPGQETRLLYDAFPYARFGSFTGKIKSVSHIVIDPRESDIPLKLAEPVYKITVALAEQNVDVSGEEVPLLPGMSLQANIVLERQSFLAWLLAPLDASSKRNT